MPETAPPAGSLAEALATIPDPRRAHLRVHDLVPLPQFAVYALRARAVLAQIRTAAKGGELAATKEALAQVDLQGRVVMGDALQTQREVCTQIVAGGGDYLLPVKENQPTLLADLAAAFSPT